MKFFIQALLFSILFNSTTHAQDSIKMISAEYHGCKFSEGKDMSDLNEFVDRWNDWMEMTATEIAIPLISYFHFTNRRVMKSITYGLAIPTPLLN